MKLISNKTFNYLQNYGKSRQFHPILLLKIYFNFIIKFKRFPRFYPKFIYEFINENKTETALTLATFREYGGLSDFNLIPTFIYAFNFKTKRFSILATNLSDDINWFIIIDDSNFKSILREAYRFNEWTPVKIPIHQNPDIRK